VPEVARHLAAVASSSQTYIETGWPLFPALPVMSRLFGRRLRIVHITRHPVSSALSYAARGSYAGSPCDDGYSRLATLGPSDPGVFATEYAGGWDQLSSFERCLFWWTEVHRFGLEMSERLDAVPLIRVRAERLLGGDRSELERLLEFIGLPWRDAWLARTRQIVDRWHHRTNARLDPMAVLEHPLAVETAARLGYDAARVDLAALEARYRGTPDPGLDRIGRYG
jgi:hypothetical protein